MDDSTATLKLGTAIREYRLALGLSQDAFADRIGMHRAYYGAVERGRRNVTITTLMRVCSGLGVLPSELFVRSGL